VRCSGMFEVDRPTSPAKILEVVRSILSWFGRDKTRQIKIDLVVLDYEVIKLEAEWKRR